ncbi:MAG: hypothetical protein JNL65_03785 [Saprospiraceae bacterium]|nr:hypothetical protein [Saprospiraceae bacterium]
MRYKLIADAGSSKTDWVFFGETQSTHFETEGINPTTQDPSYLETVLEKTKFHCPDHPDIIIFYGAGCTSQSAKDLLTALLAKQFPKVKIVVHSDILGCGRGLCEGQEGVVAILGTGSHAARCDGHVIVHQLPSLGFLLGDEASGNYLGKKLLQLYFLNKMDAELKQQFEKQYPELNHDFIYQLYHSKKPASKLADFARFVIQHKNTETLKPIIKLGIEEFIENRILVYKHDHLPVHLCGSIGYFLRDEFRTSLDSYGLIFGNCSQKLIQHLLAYHLKYETH